MVKRYELLYNITMSLREKLIKFMPKKECVVAERIFQPISTGAVFPEPIIYGRIKDVPDTWAVQVGTRIVGKFSGTQSQIAEQINLDIEKRGLNF